MKMKYIPKRNIESITIVDPKDKNKTIVIPGSETISGEHKFKKGGKLLETHSYISRSDVKYITLKDGTIEKDFLNGVWISNKALDKNNTSGKNPEQKAIEFLKGMLRAYESDKSSANRRYLKMSMPEEIVMEGLDYASNQSGTSDLLSIMIECYQKLGLKSNGDFERPFHLLYETFGGKDHLIDYNESEKAMKMLEPKYLSSAYKINPVVVSRQKPLEEQSKLLSLINQFTYNVDDYMADERAVVSIKIEKGNVVATDMNTMINLILPSEKQTDTFIKHSALAKKSKSKKTYPDYRRIIDTNIDDYGKSFTLSKVDFINLINHLNATIVNGLTSSNYGAVILKMPNGRFVGFSASLLLRCLSAMKAIGYDSVDFVYAQYATVNKALFIIPAKTGKMEKFVNMDCTVCMPIFITDNSFNYFYWDVKEAKVMTTPKNFAEILTDNFAKGGTLFGDDDSDLDMEDVYAKGGDVPVSDPLEHDQLYTIYNVKTGTDKHSAIVAQEVIDIVKTDAGPDADINTLAEAKVYLEQNGYLLDEIEVEFALGGGLADNMSVDDIARIHEVSKDVILNQLKKGIQVEMEHTNNKIIAREIAMDHLVESPVYYTLLEDMEQKFAKGGQTKGKRIGFKALAEKVSKAYEGKPVPSRYKSLYGKTYSKKEADLVGQKVAAKVYRNQSK